jgi:hypothetical protein
VQLKRSYWPGRRTKEAGSFTFQSRPLARVTIINGIMRARHSRVVARQAPSTVERREQLRSHRPPPQSRARIRVKEKTQAKIETQTLRLYRWRWPALRTRLAIGSYRSDTKCVDVALKHPQWSTVRRLNQKSLNCLRELGPKVTNHGKVARPGVL